MAVGTVSTSILTDIANAIRYQAGVAQCHSVKDKASARGHPPVYKKS